jgi:hypothetical protein
VVGFGVGSAEPYTYPVSAERKTEIPKFGKVTLLQYAT